MPDTLSQALRDWQNFYILAGGASATLAGLMFVAISLGSTGWPLIAGSRCGRPFPFEPFPFRV